MAAVSEAAAKTDASATTAPAAETGVQDTPTSPTQRLRPTATRKVEGVAAASVNEKVEGPACLAAESEAPSEAYAASCSSKETAELEVAEGLRRMAAKRSEDVADIASYEKHG